MNDRTKLRRFVHRIANRRLYQAAADFLNALQVMRVGGMGAYRGLKQTTLPKGKRFCEVTLKNVPHPIQFRPGTADANTIIQNLVRHEYGRFEGPVDPVAIIDAGGFIGDLSIFFYCRFPRARIVTLEPNPDNYELASLNLGPYSDRVSLVNAGLWSEPTTLTVTGESTGSRLVASDAEGGTRIRCLDVDAVMAQAGFERIDILKLDIEGAEREVLCAPRAGWLRATKLVIVEFHGEELERDCLAVLRANGFECYRYRSLFYCYNSNASPSATSIGR